MALLQGSLQLLLAGKRQHHILDELLTCSQQDLEEFQSLSTTSMYILYTFTYYEPAKNLKNQTLCTFQISTFQLTFKLSTSNQTVFQLPTVPVLDILVCIPKRTCLLATHSSQVPGMPFHCSKCCVVVLMDR